MRGIHRKERENRKNKQKSKQKKRKTHLTHTGLLMEGFGVVQNRGYDDELAAHPKEDDTRC
jgi:hypothetical protein